MNANQIEKLRQEARRAGDDDQVDRCNAALAGNEYARDECQAVIDAARAMAMNTCEACGCQGIESDWPGNDPRNADEPEVVLCADADGHLVCDDCAAEGNES